MRGKERGKNIKTLHNSIQLFFVKKKHYYKPVVKACYMAVGKVCFVHKSASGALDCTQPDIRGANISMGVMPTLLCGDFRQILPVVMN